MRGFLLMASYPVRRAGETPTLLSLSLSVFADQFRFDRHMNMGMRVGIILLRIDHSDGCHIDDHFDRRGTLQHVDRAAHAHKNRADEFAAADLRYQLSRNIGRSQIGENEYVGATLQGAEGILLFDDQENDTY